MLVIADHLSPKMAAALHDAGVQFVDTDGNASIRFASVIVDPRPQAALERTWQGDRIGPEPLQPAAIASNPDATDLAGVGKTRRPRSCACGGVSTGQAHDTLDLLESTGFPSNLDMARRRDLLDLWAPTYITALGPTLTLASFVGDPERPVERVHPNQLVYVSGESAHGVGVRRPQTMTVYVQGQDSKFPIVNRWQRKPDAAATFSFVKSFGLPPMPTRKSRSRWPECAMAPRLWRSPPIARAASGRDGPRLAGAICMTRLRRQPHTPTRRSRGRRAAAWLREG